MLKARGHIARTSVRGINDKVIRALKGRWHICEINDLLTNVIWKKLARDLEKTDDLAFRNLPASWQDAIFFEEYPGMNSGALRHGAYSTQDPFLIDEFYSNLRLRQRRRSLRVAEYLS